MWMYFRGFERLIVTLCVPLLLYIGYRLFMTGVTGDMKITANMTKWSGSITAVTPGSLCFLLGVVLGSYVMFSKVTDTAPDGNTVSMLGGSGSVIKAPLSMGLKVAMGELSLCKLSLGEADQQVCNDKFNQSFKLIPTQKDIEQIEQAEAAVKRGDAGASEKYFSLQMAFEK
jgi:hypothetical protein